MTLLKKKKTDDNKKLSAREQDKQRKVQDKTSKKVVNQKRNIKNTTMKTMPYECFVSGKRQIDRVF